MIKNTSAQVIIVSMWIVLALALLVIAVAHQLSMELRLNRYYRDKTKAYYLAHAAVMQALTVIGQDVTPADSLLDPWANNETLFKKITLLGQEGWASVSYAQGQDIIFGVRDEEGRINLNSGKYCDQALLESLLINLGEMVPEAAAALAYNIRAWRGDLLVGGDSAYAAAFDESHNYSSMGYDCKQKPFAVIEELVLVKGMTAEVYEKIKSAVTVEGGGKVNINTADEKPLAVVISACIGKVGSSGDVNPQELARKIITARPFADDSLVEINDPDNPGLLPLLNEMKNYISVNSENFAIKAQAFSPRNIICGVESVYNSTSKRFVAWQEH